MKSKILFFMTFFVTNIATANTLGPDFSSSHYRASLDEGLSPHKCFASRVGGVSISKIVLAKNPQDALKLFVNKELTLDREGRLYIKSIEEKNHLNVGAYCDNSPTAHIE